MSKHTFVLICLSFICTGKLAIASLGGTESSVAVDQTHFSGKTLKVTPVKPNPNLTIEAFDANAFKVREYVSTSGVVFGIAWEGSVQPDLEVLLGTYFQEYRDGKANNPKIPGKRSHEHKSAQLVIQQNGHMRKLQGRAYDPNLIPSGVTEDEIK